MRQTVRQPAHTSCDGQRLGQVSLEKQSGAAGSTRDRVSWQIACAARLSLPLKRRSRVRTPAECGTRNARYRRGPGHGLEEDCREDEQADAAGVDGGVSV